MFLIKTAIVLSLVAALIDWWIGIKEPWRKIVYFGVVILLVVGVILLVFPDFLPLRLYS